MTPPGLPAPPCPGLLAAWRFRPGQPPENLDEPAAAAAIAAGVAGLWLHFDLVDQRARATIATLPLPAAARTALLEPDDSTHLDVLGGALCGTIPDFHFESDRREAAELALLHLALTPGLLVTARRHPLSVVGAVARRPEGTHPGAALGAILRGLAEAAGQAIQGMSDRLARLEDALLHTPDLATERVALAAMRRAALRLERNFGATAEALGELDQDPPEGMEHEVFAPVFREARRFAALSRSLGTVKERGRIAQDELAGLAAEKTNQRLFVLSVISAVMLPPALIAGIFGMNVGNLPGVEAPWGFALAMLLIIGSIGGVLAALRWFRMM
ncbi:zinc transporter [Humitalea rosea]|uniref:Zinc transporter n=1 Tax=Humitalea rosea TaxID=990373 RepID=A0A2W7JSE4_9PROT|nr:CorA family divalent cation transporter [Humitalea rosea]PZW37856.1 zinc transporter [Humitalea rosea]